MTAVGNFAIRTKKRAPVKRQTVLLDSDLPEDSPDEFDDYADPGLNAPKRGPIRRKERFRTRDYDPEGKHKGRKRNDRSSIRYDFEL